MSSHSGKEFAVGEILGERKSSGKGLEFLVRWKGYGKSDDSWEAAKNLKTASKLIDTFRAKVGKKKTGRRSTSRSRSRSSRSRSKSKSPARQKKGASPSRQSSRGRKSVTTTTTTVTPTRNEETVETVSESPGKFERTETITKSLTSPGEVHRTSIFTKTTESSTQRTTSLPAKASQRLLGRLKNCCGCVTRSDYPAMVVFSCIIIITLSFLLEKNVDFGKVWASLCSCSAGMWAWLTALVPKGEATQGKE